MITKEFGNGKGIKTGNKPNDDILTPHEISKMIIDMFDIQGLVLDPFKGEGSFYNQYSSNCLKDWCEIKEGKDFFEYNQKVDWMFFHLKR